MKVTALVKGMCIVRVIASVKRRNASVERCLDSVTHGAITPIHAKINNLFFKFVYIYFIEYNCFFILVCLILIHITMTLGYTTHKNTGL